MKRTGMYLVLMVAILFPLCTFGQLLNAGFRGGVNTNRFITTSSGFQSSEPSIGLTGGVFVRVKVGRFSFQPEMLLSHKSGLIPYSLVGGNSDTLLRASLQQLDIPLVVNFHLGRFIRFGTGPVIGYGVGEKVTINTKGSNYTLVIDKGVFKPTSYSWQFGFALEFRRVFFDARYELGIDKLNYEIPIPGEPIVFNPVIHNRTWQFTIGYKFVKRRN
jgi:hypothetical protein